MNATGKIQGNIAAMRQYLLSLSPESIVMMNDENGRSSGWLIFL